MQFAHRTTSRPRGTAYVLVLAISMLVAVIGAAAISIVRVQLRTTTLSSDSEEARIYAQSAIELAKQWCYTNATWRTDGTRPAGGNTSLTLGTGSFTIAYSDPIDGNVANSPLDTLLITATGYKGSARQQIQCTLSPAPVVYSSVRSAVSVGGNITVNGGMLQATGSSISSNGNMTVASACAIDGDCYAVGSFTGTNYIGSRTAGVTARTMPGASVFDYYITNGTAISYAATAGKMKDITLNSTTSSYGTVNPKGIYVVDCGGQTMKVQKCSITGTLVLLNVKNDSTVEGGAVMTSGAPGMPALMVQGTITHNGDKDINGLVYVSGTFWNATAQLGINGGLIVGGSLVLTDDLIVTWNGSYVTNPPPGFFDNPPMKVVASSWKQVVN